MISLRLAMVNASCKTIKARAVPISDLLSSDLISVSDRSGAGCVATPKERPAVSMACTNSAAYGSTSGRNITATRASAGTSSRSNSSHLPPIENSRVEKPVLTPPGRARSKRILEPPVRDQDKDDWCRPVNGVQCGHTNAARRQDDVGVKLQKLCGMSFRTVGVGNTPAIVYDQVPASSHPAAARPRLNGAR